MRRRWWLIGLLSIVLVGACVVVVRWATEPEPTRLEAAMELAPPGAVRFGWTDWAAVRREVETSVSASSVQREVEDFLADAFDADLSPFSALVSSTPVLHERYGVSPASLEWELFAQGETGAVVLMGLADDLNLDELRSRLTRLGYAAPEDADGVWDGGDDVLSSIGRLSPELSYLRIDAQHQVLAASDQRESLLVESSEGASEREDPSVGGVARVVDALGEVPAAGIYAGTYACGALAMTQAAPDAQSEAATLLDAAGEVHAYDAYGVGGGPDEVRVAMAFESQAHARTDADTRSVLAAGPSPGQGGSFSDRFTLGEVVADDRVLTMDLTPAPRAFVLSELTAGPVLLATC